MVDQAIKPPTSFPHSRHSALHTSLQGPPLRQNSVPTASLRDPRLPYYYRHQGLRELLFSTTNHHCPLLPFPSLPTLTSIGILHLTRHPRSHPEDTWASYYDPHPRTAGKYTRCKGNRDRPNVLLSRAQHSLPLSAKPPNARRRRCDFAPPVAKPHSLGALKTQQTFSGIEHRWSIRPFSCSQLT